ncbi:MAG: hypothetical protein KC414_13910 [Romboutsia sp.]|nr:hypothetical protein [Romboutsia sp.]
MRIEVNDKDQIELSEVYNPIKLQAEKESIILQMRDDGFELTYNNELYSINKGKITKINNKRELELIKLVTSFGYNINKKEKIISVGSLPLDVQSPSFFYLM